MSTKTDRPAGHIVCQCAVCHGQSFKLLGYAPKGLAAGEVIPPGSPREFALIECLACGEEYKFSHPRSVEPNR